MARSEERLSWHFLRRRAEKSRIRWKIVQRGASMGRSDHLTLLVEAGITADDEIVVRKRGKWDARYDVVAVPR